MRTQTEQNWGSERPITISSASQATLLSVGTETLSSFQEHKSSLTCPLDIYLYAGKVRNKNQLLCAHGSAH